MTYSWQNEDGEPIMSGEAWRFEQQLDMDARDDYLADHFYDDDEDFDFIECESEDCDEDVRDCGHDGRYGDQYDPIEDQWLDGYMEDRLTTMFGD